MKQDQTATPKELITVAEYATRMGVSRTTVYLNINGGKIITDMEELSNVDTLINWNIYKHFRFGANKKRAK